MTDLALAVVAGVIAGRLLSGDRPVERAWAYPCLSIAVGAGLGTIYHGWLKGGMYGGATWGLITITLAATMTLLLEATLASVYGAGRRWGWLTIEVATFAAVVVAVLSGHPGLGWFGLFEAPVMAAIVALWGKALRTRLPGSGWIVAAMALSGAAAIFKSGVVSFQLGWDWDANSLYHLAQLPGLVVLYFGVQRLRPAASLEGAVAVSEPRQGRLRPLLTRLGLGWNSLFTR
jgi:hypothetical protein